MRGWPHAPHNFFLFCALIISLAPPQTRSSTQAKPNERTGMGMGEESRRPRMSKAPRGVCRGGGQLGLFFLEGRDTIVPAGGVVSIAIRATPPSTSGASTRNVRSEAVGEAAELGWTVQGFVEREGFGWDQGINVKLEDGHTRGSYSFDGLLEVRTKMPGTYAATVELVGVEGLASGCVAHVRFVAEAEGYNKTHKAMDECETPPKTRTRTWYSPCAASLQIAHEQRIVGRHEAAEALVVHAISASASRDGERDAAHAMHVYGYLEMAQSLHSRGMGEDAARCLHLIQRLQPGYTLPRPLTAPAPSSSELSFDFAKVSAVDLGQVQHLVCEWTAYELQAQAGMSSMSAADSPGGHYKLLHYVASLMRGATIVEMGTMHGASALALASGHASNRVITYNVLDDFSPNARACGMTGDEYMRMVAEAGCSIQYRILDVMSSPEGMEQMSKAELIHIDINHHGDIEDAVLQYLAGKDYKGIVLLDDIYLNPSMDALWGSIGNSEEWQPCKYDVTDWGHSIAGTGLIDFGCRLAILGAS